MYDNNRKFRKKLRTIIVLLFLSLMAFSAITNIIIARNYDRFIYNNTKEVPRKDVALVLGTSRSFHGRLNLYYTSRLKAASALYKDGKIKKILVSGDNSTKYYNEPITMQKDLVNLGVKEEDIHLDYAGFSTLDSVIRAKKVFSLDEFIIISQEFHCERALFIARSRNIEAIAYATPYIEHKGKIKIFMRELLARIKAGLDIWIINRSPKFLGEKVEII
ncbi:MAG: YdcF family protein [Deltaproteobacteria bacterium]|nr:YdcF family protein [Deltaproteobacteria bacterium]